MATNSKIWFGGRLLPCTVERFPAIKKAQRKFRQYNVPGRNGDVFFQDDAFENVVASYDVYATDEYFGAVEAWKNLAAVLYQKGYQKLRDTYDPDHFRKAVFNGPIDVENSWNTHGRATIEFNCRPERYLVDGATSVGSFESATGPVLWKRSGLSNFLKNNNWPAGTEEVYEFDIPSSWGTEFQILNYQDPYGDGRLYVADITNQTPDAANSGTFASYPYVYAGGFSQNHLGYPLVTWLIPAQYFNGIPQLQGTDAIDTDERYNYGTAGEDPVTNPYMPCYPDIVLHNLAAHTGEVLAAHINQYGIYIDYDQDAPYYFVDTENATIMKSDALNGNKILATNARMDAGIKLEQGENIVYTSDWYEIPELVPNFWEL